MSAQSALNALGYDAGVVDGLEGTKSREAMRAFERDHNLTQLGLIDENAVYQLIVALSAKAQC